MAKKKKKFSIPRLLINLLLIIVLVAGAYVAYVFVRYHRIGNLALEPKGEGVKAVETGCEYSAVSWNIGYGAYEDDYDFFMDGGHQSRARSEERLDANLWSIARNLDNINAEIYLIQEVDIGSTRSYHRDETVPLVEKLNNCSYVFCQNYDSPYLVYPFYQPHGASKSGLMTFSKFYLSTVDRIELPVESGFMKFLDLDRCYSKSRVRMEGDKELLIYNFHFSAFTSDGKISEEQLVILLDDMNEEAKKGNYCIAGGDFNKDLLGNSAKIFGKPDKELSWTKPIPEGVFDDYNISLVVPFDEGNPKASCRNPDSAYHEEQYVVTVDGFLVSDNIEVIVSGVVPYEFKYSDHNPVYMRFKLK